MTVTLASGTGTPASYTKPWCMNVPACRTKTLLVDHLVPKAATTNTPPGLRPVATPSAETVRTAICEAGQHCGSTRHTASFVTSRVDPSAKEAVAVYCAV